MKRIFVLFIIVVTGCYDDDSTQIVSDNTAHVSSELTSLIKSMSLHNASYDDVVDNSSCFSIEFPYQLSVNSSIRTVNSVQDIEDINNDDTIEIIYPVNAIFYNYDRHQLTSTNDYEQILNACEEGFDLSPHLCLDFEYPFSIKMFNQLGNDFHTTQLFHDQDTFTILDNLNDADIYEIEYPILLSDHAVGTTVSITSNVQFEALFHNTLGDCQ